MPKITDLPQFFEELKLKEEITIPELVAQFKQRIPTDYLEIALEEGNYCGSTNPKWKNKPLCERYGFTYQNQWTQLDIPHDLLEKVKLSKEKDIVGSIFLNPQVLNRKSSYGGIVLENETEIILVSPQKIAVKEQGTQTELSINNIEKLEELKKVVNSQKTGNSSEKFNWDIALNEFAFRQRNSLDPSPNDDYQLLTDDLQYVCDKFKLINKRDQGNDPDLDSNRFNVGWQAFWSFCEDARNGLPEIEKLQIESTNHINDKDWITQTRNHIRQKHEWLFKKFLSKEETLNYLNKNEYRFQYLNKIWQNK